MATLKIHIGIHKTGSTAIQNACISRKNALAAQGVLFPATGFVVHDDRSFRESTPGHSRIARAFENAGRGGRKEEKARAVLSDLFDEFRASDCHTILLSSERFSKPSDQGYHSGLSFFTERGFDIDVLGYLRRQDHWLESFYRQRLRPTGVARETRPLSQWYEEEGLSWLDYRHRLSAWLRNPAVRSVVLRSYDDINATGDIVVDFFAQAKLAYVHVAADDSRSAVYNPSLPATVVDLVRAYNSQPDVESLANDRFVRSLMDFAGESTDGSLVSDKLWSDIRNVCAPLNDDLSEQLMSGPADLFRFPQIREQVVEAHQVVSYEQARKLITALREAWSAPQNDPGASTGRAGKRSRSVLAKLLRVARGFSVRS